MLKDALEDLKKKRVAVAGLGIEGLSTVNYLLKHGIVPTVLDEKLDEHRDEIKELESKDVKFELGNGVLAKLLEFDVVFRSPGISSLRPELVAAKEKGVIIISQTKFFLENCPSPVIGVTGTKGKGTTSTLIFEMLQKAGFSAYLGGNIGKPVLDFLDNLGTQDKVVLELSSFQLMDVTTSPHVAVVLMVTSEHLDYHADVNEYVEAKRNILRFQTASDFAIINRDYIASHESDIYTDAQVFQVSVERPCERGCYVKDKKVFVRVPDLRLPTLQMTLASGDEARSVKSSGFSASASEKASVSEAQIISIDKVALPGRHNLENVCAAVMAATLAGVNKESIVSVLKTFKGLEHRLQLVRELNGVKYYDDSFSTTPETTIAAIESFEQPEILVLGGSSKHSDFSELGKVIRTAKNIKAIIGIGEEWERIKLKIKNEELKIGQKDEINEELLFIEGAKSMEQVVLAASKIAQSGDVVLLSPACASFGMFKNYKERGEQFAREVNSL